MSHVVVKHKVKDYSAWKSVFDNFKDVRKKGGEKSYQIYQPEDDPNNLILHFEWDTRDRAKSFMQSEELKSAMKNAGVTEAPEVYFTELAAEGKL